MAKKKKRGGLGKRYNHSEKTAGGSSKSVFNLPPEAKYFKPKEGRNKFNIIPYEVKSKNHPMVKSGEMEIGDLDYIMDIYIHRNVGIAEQDVVCLKMNYGKKCPLCEIADEYKNKGKDTEFNNTKASRRVFYNVRDERSSSDELKVFSVSHFLFEKELIEEARAEAKDKKILDFADIENGFVIHFRASETQRKTYKYFEFKSFKFVEREEELDEDLIDDAISFDECIKVMAYEEIEALYYGNDEDDDEEEEPPKENKTKKKRVEEDDDDDDDEDDDDEDDDDEDDDDEEEPPKKPTPKKPTPKKPTPKNKCPHGHKFGKDTDEHKECDTCEVWDTCADAGE